MISVRGGSYGDRLRPPEGLTAELDAVSVVDEPVQDGVGDCGVAEGLGHCLTGSWLVTMVVALV